jgi:O-antigen/teichoic acid export membrane protein
LLRSIHKDSLFVFDYKTKKILKIIFGYSLWVFIIRLSSTVVNQLDKIIVSTMLGVSQLPIYVGVSRVLKIVGQLNSLLKSAVLPIASEVSSTNDKELLEDLSFRGTKIFNAIFGPLTVSIILFAHPILNLIGGKVVAEYYLALQIGSLCLLPVLCRAFLNTIVMGTGHIIHYQSIWSVLTSIVYLVVCIAGIYIYGLYGAILAHPVSHVLMMVPWLYIIFKHIDLSVFDFWKAVFLGQWPSLILLGVAYPVVDRLFSQSVYLIGFYFIIFVIFSLFLSLYLTIEKNYRLQIYKMLSSKFKSL